MDPVPITWKLWTCHKMVGLNPNLHRLQAPPLRQEALLFYAGIQWALNHRRNLKILVGHIFRINSFIQFNPKKTQRQYDMKENLEGKVCLITGATNGIGEEAAKQICLMGADIFFVARNQDKAKEQA
jgi:hypothetical protein